MASKINLKPEEVGVYAIGGLGKSVKTPMVLNTKMRLSSSMRVLNSPRMIFSESIMLSRLFYIVENVDRVKALVITHGHEDHIGGIPFLLKQANIPIYAGPLALALIKGKLEEHGLLRDAQLYEINANTELTFKNMSVDLLPHHSLNSRTSRYCHPYTSR